MIGGINIFYLFLIVIIVIVDQFVKSIIKKKLEGIYTKPIIKNVFHLTLVKNTGAAFSIFKDKQKLILILNIPSIIFIFYVFFIILEYDFTLIKIAISFMLGGSIGNFIDRIRLRYVIDYIHIKFKRVPIFNIADVFILLGSLILIYTMIFGNYNLRF